MNLTEYLQFIRLQLTMPDRRAEQIITEIRQHIADQIKQNLLNGVSPSEAEQLACEEFGQPAAVSARFNTTYRHPLHSFWRIIGVVLATSTVIRILIIDVFQFSEYGRKFALSVGPGFYDREFIVYSCIGFVIGGVLMARFIYHYFAQININQRVLRLSLLLASMLTAGYHLIFSVIKIAYGMVFANDLMLALRFFDASGSGMNFTEINVDMVSLQGVWYYASINLFYLAITTLILLLTMQLVFWFLQKRTHTAALTSAE